MVGTGATYRDLVVLAAIGALATLSVTAASRVVLRITTYVFKWAFAWAVLNALLFAMNSFPAYSLARDVLLQTASRIYNTAGLESASELAMSTLQTKLQEYRAEL
jgi:hypothetical protein